MKYNPINIKKTKASSHFDAFSNKCTKSKKSTLKSDTITYRFAFNGQEKDNEVSGDGNSYDYGFRIYNSRLGRFLSVDSLTYKYPELTPYQFASNTPNAAIDLDGLEAFFVIEAFSAVRNLLATETARQIAFACNHPIAAEAIGQPGYGRTNISANAGRLARHTNFDFGNDKEGGLRNGYRHVLWQASIASMYGGAIAQQAGDSHEENPNVDLSRREFDKGNSGLLAADQTADLLNNIIGRAIGEKNPNLSEKDLSILVLEEFKNNGFYTAVLNKNGTYSITQTKINEEQYKIAKKNLNATGANGMTPQEKTEVQENQEKNRPAPVGLTEKL